MLFKICSTFLDMLMRSEHFQDYCYSHCNKYGKYTFENLGQNFTIQEALIHYHTDDIRQTDIVLDIGAHVGGFTVFASEKAKKVFAVEPLYEDVLIKNLKRNNIHNVRVLRCGLGNGSMKLWFFDRRDEVICYSLADIIKICGSNIDFLKLDCEGGEWFILPSELQGIRRIEAEVHTTPEHKPYEFLKVLDDAGFKYSYENISKTLMIVHAISKLYIPT